MLEAKAQIDSAYIQARLVYLNDLKNRESDSVFIIGNQLRNEIKNHPKFSYAYSQIKAVEANLYYRKKEYKEALSMYDEILQESIESGDTNLMAFAYYSKANVYQYIDMYQESIPLFKKSIELVEHSGKTRGWAQKVRNLGESYYYVNEYDSSMLEMNKVIRTIASHKDTVYLLVAMSYKAHSFLHKYDDYKDVVYIDSARLLLAHCDSILGDQAFDPLSFVKAELSFRLRNYRQVIDDLRLPLEKDLNRQLSFKSQIPRISKMLYVSHENLGHLDSAMFYMDMYLLYSDSIEFLDSKRSTQKLDLALNYKNQKSKDEMALAAASKQKALEQEAAELEQRLYTISGVLVVILILIVAFVVYLRSKKLKNLYLQLNERTKDLKDSITYAKRIQDTILPSEKEMSTVFNEHFVYYQPKDVVAGDFYWIKLKDDYIYFAVADCTGHGVPGALVSLICHEAMEKAVYSCHQLGLNELMDKVRDLVISKLNSKGYEEVKDGMDIAMCRIKKGSSNLEFVGAHSPLWLVRGKEMIQLKGDRQPVGLYEHAKPFNAKTYTVVSGDVIYMSSDGYPDQFGGDSGKKFKSSRLKKSLLEKSINPLENQKISLSNEFNAWMADFEQLDDVCVMGVKI